MLKKNNKYIRYKTKNKKKKKIVVAWKIVGALNASVLYRYIDDTS